MRNVIGVIALVLSVSQVSADEGSTAMGRAANKAGDAIERNAEALHQGSKEAGHKTAEKIKISTKIYKKKHVV